MEISKRVILREEHNYDPDPDNNSMTRSIVYYRRVINDTCYYLVRIWSDYGGGVTITNIHVRKEGATYPIHSFQFIKDTDEYKNS